MRLEDSGFLGRLRIEFPSYHRRHHKFVHLIFGTQNLANSVEIALSASTALKVHWVSLSLVIFFYMAIEQVRGSVYDEFPCEKLCDHYY